MKEKVRKEHFCGKKNSEVKTGDVVAGINSRAEPLIRYVAAFIKWTRDELGTMDRKTRK